MLLIVIVLTIAALGGFVAGVKTGARLGRRRAFTAIERELRTRRPTE